MLFEDGHLSGLDKQEQDRHAGIGHVSGLDSVNIDQYLLFYFPLQPLTFCVKCCIIEHLGYSTAVSLC